MVLVCCLSTVLALPLFAQPQRASDKKAVPGKPAAKPEQPSAKSPGVAAQTRVNPKDGQRYVWIPPGTFRMGCSPGDSECDGDQKPAHSVTISRGFWLGQTEVTVAAFQALSRSTGTAVPSGQKGDRHPVVNVTWDEAGAYCQAIGGRLPSEAEWEYAARGGVNAARYGTLDAVAWYSSNSGSSTHEVATKQANAYGLYDMLGNVWEWVADWHGIYSAGVETDPQGPSSGQNRVVRGGSWIVGPKGTRASLRGGDLPGGRANDGGLRCAWE